MPESELVFPNEGTIIPERLTDKWVEEYAKNRWLGLGDVSAIVTDNPFDHRTIYDQENPHIFVLNLMRDPKYFGWTVKQLLNKDLAPFQLAILRELWLRPFPMLIGARGASKSWMLALYFTLRMLFNQGTKIAVVGAAFRQSKVVFDYMVDLWENAPLLRDIVGVDKKNGPKRDVDRCSMRFGDSITICLPLGTGAKLRGQRANVVAGEEFGSIPVDIFETVVRGFASVSQSPVEKYQTVMHQQAMIELGLWKAGEALADERHLQSNQTIIAGTAYWAFNHFYEYWKRYKAIVESRGDERKLQEIFHGAIPDGFRWQDYSVIRIPVTALPSGFMDAKQIGQAKATVASGIYLMEYGACQAHGTKVVTSTGVKEIQDVTVGDMVLTHRGRFRPVTKRTYRVHEGTVIRYRTMAYNADVVGTPNHPYWDGEDGWQPLSTVEDNTYLTTLYELNGTSHIDVRSRVSNFRETTGRLFPTPSQATLSNDAIADIRSSTESRYVLAERYGVACSCIQYTQTDKRLPKNSIPATIPLNYDFGLIIGYYASEGSCGAAGKSVGFALDGHHDVKLEAYVDQLKTALTNIFGFVPKVYAHDTVANVTVNQRLVVDLIKNICPGVSHTKFIDPDILYSNEEFLSGFIVGYWNGDGHISANGKIVTARCVNQSLLGQIRVGLSYFGIASSMSECKVGGKSVFRGKSYDNRPTYSLSVFGKSGRVFRDRFYGQQIQYRQTHQKSGIVVSSNKVSLPVVNRIRERFSGLVYNLEVEEDHSYSLLNATVHNCFVTDSNGFFRRSLIEACVASRKHSISHPSCGEIHFNATLRGNPVRKHVIAVDPASEVDNFAISVVELWPDHRRIVHCWTTTRARYKAKAKRGLSKEGDYYAFAARKIRDLKKAFPSDDIAIDAQGGGVAVIEALQDPHNLQPGEVPFYPVIDPDKPADTDNLPGDHCIRVIQFANAEWTRDANHGMKKDFEDKALLFPDFDTAVLALSLEEDKMSGRVKIDQNDSTLEKLYDTLEDCVLEIEELKDELATIIHSQTPSGREHWDTPQTNSGEHGKKGRLRKDRYSSLLMANMVARQQQRTIAEPEYQAYGGFASAVSGAGGPSRPGETAMYVNAPAWWTNGPAATYGAIVKRA